MDSPSLALPWHIPRQKKTTLIPVFLPFYGCPVRCIFCAQHIQTGQDGPDPPRHGSSKTSGKLAAILAAARWQLQQRYARGLAAAELAFYGGTFTALPPAGLGACLDLACEAQERGWISSFRCSTRPDCVDAAVLAALHRAGCSTVELGVQSFSDRALGAARRGYDRKRVLDACALVRAAGLQLGVQLLPGMPGHSPALFQQDVQLALASGAAMLRFYPCLVLQGTELARLWSAGAYTPWSLETAVQALAEGWLQAVAAAVPVIRMGLAAEDSLQRAFLAGPMDPALGSRVMARALLLTVRRALARQGQEGVPFDMQLPPGVQGYFWGNRRELAPDWAALGLQRVFFTGECGIDIFFHGPSAGEL
jgi:histone acetyltransferase (RNA polymerase elongator complex component)